MIIEDKKRDWVTERGRRALCDKNAGANSQFREAPQKQRFTIYLGNQTSFTNC